MNYNKRKMCQHKIRATMLLTLGLLIVLLGDKAVFAVNIYEQSLYPPLPRIKFKSNGQVKIISELGDARTDLRKQLPWALPNKIYPNTAGPIKREDETTPSTSQTTDNVKVCFLRVF